ncbi:exodeoxyribonuclease VII large subunit [Pseudomaricurvus alcaniphilus]|uniref:exodeoxyribonuclease VII large subunit n=1 Tax=Pseudomaricurvus alcaniphilus TaxID=1166482 RepID=UPI001409F1C1|nr:exodeoxyribonuclease VII large subunit [Pseudomaricurvus alcaniphilus]NHN39930.1 exodeoxyribonuclease VII large subunit [Pseudomaricurvus alcaniphilus]
MPAMKDVEPLQIQRDILTVSQLNRRARQLLETHLPLLWVEGEISNFARPSSGHWYFTLKDANAQVKCAMFRNRNQAVRQLPQHGQQVLVRGRVSLYEGRGDYQMIVEHLEDAGFGALQRAFEQLKHKLLQEGLFDPAYKQPLPRLPRHIGIITSPTGAAIRDILHVLQRRFPAIPVSLFPVAVQGSAAAGEIVAALQLANAQSDCDVLIVGRGGGSLEDLWPFNEESVARAIFASRIPVISAVGHEVDTTIADFVADLRAPTPSAAAELCTPDGNEMLQQFARYQQLLLRAINTRIREDRHRLSARSSRLQHPAQRLQAQAQHLDNLEIRLRQVVQARLQRLAVRLDNVAGRCQQENPGTRVETLVKQVEQLGRRLNASVQQVLQLKRQALGQQSALLDSVNPLSVLQRGYSLTSDTSGKVIRSSTDINSGDQIITRLGSGKLVSTVDTVE